MDDRKKTKLLYVGLGVVCGWLLGGLANMLWFLYSAQVLGYGENAPAWYAALRGVLRPLVILLFMAAGALAGLRNFRRALRRGRFGSS